MKRCGLFYGNKGRRKFICFYDSEAVRDMEAYGWRAIGFRVRCFNRKPEPVTYYGA